MSQDSLKIPEYILMDPTGNITALVTEPVEPEERRNTAALIMSREPAAEQLGFLCESKNADIDLEMAGGEFCGNATMCAAVFFAANNNLSSGTVNVDVSGVNAPVNVEVEILRDGSWRGTVEMPVPEAVEVITFLDGCSLPVVHLPGADHIILETEQSLEDPDRPSLENRLRSYSEEMGSLCAGLMNYNSKTGRLDPLVYVPGIDSMFWEHSCASGTTAVGAWAAAFGETPVSLCLHEPGGPLTVKVSNDNKYLLSGSVRFLNS